jgi:hypothetical protein
VPPLTDTVSFINHNTSKSASSIELDSC